MDSSKSLISRRVLSERLIHAASSNVSESERLSRVDEHGLDERSRWSSESSTRRIWESTRIPALVEVLLNDGSSSSSGSSSIRSSLDGNEVAISSVGSGIEGFSNSNDVGLDSSVRSRSSSRKGG